MMKLRRTVCIEAPVERVWQVLSNLPAISPWVPAIRHAHCPEQARGVGAMRVCELERFTVRETIVAWHEGRSFTYQGVGAPMMRRAQNTWSVEAHDGMTLVTSEAEVTIKGGVLGLLLQPLVTLMSARLGDQSLASLKYLVEHGHPAPVGQALLRGPVSC